MTGFQFGDIPDWFDDAACVDPDVDPDWFFPERGYSLEPAKRVCRGCPVRGECLEYALDKPERFGVWGGLSERERKNLRRSRRDSRRLALGA